MNTDLSISFIKAHHQTIGQLKKRSEEIGNFKKSVEKEGNKLNTQNGYSENISPFNPSLLPQTDILTQININNVQNTETKKADVFRDLEIEIV